MSYNFVIEKRMGIKEFYDKYKGLDETQVYNKIKEDLFAESMEKFKEEFMKASIFSTQSLGDGERIYRIKALILFE